MPSTQLTLSIIMPLHNGLQYLERSVGAVRVAWDAAYELIIVDDAGTDGSGELAEALTLKWKGARVLRLQERLGAAGARNAGAAQATGDILVFIDADVAVHEDTLRKIAGAFSDDLSLAALFGSYDDQPGAAGVISSFRNLLHHFVHQQGSGAATTFWTGCGAVRREAFREVGPFRDASIECMEDIDYGHRLRDAGLAVELRSEIQCTHLKKWTFGSMVYTDIFRRAVPWTVMMLRRRRHDDTLNVTHREQASAALACGMVMCLVAAFVQPAFLLAAAAGLCGLIALQWRFYCFLYDRRGGSFAAVGLLLHVVYYLCAVAGAGIGVMVYAARGAKADCTGLK